MIAQDAGSATIGPARADIYWGTGKQAATLRAAFVILATSRYSRPMSSNLLRLAR